MTAVPMALLVAVLFAVSAYLQQRAGRDRRLGFGLMRHPLWWSGWLLNLVAFAGQAAALRLGSVAIVQSVVGLQVLVVLLLAAAEERRLPGWATWLAGAGCCGSAAVLVLGIGVDTFSGPPNREHALLAVVSAAAGVGVIVWRGRRHVLPLAIAAGCCSAVTAVLLKLTASRLVDDGPLALATDWVGYALAASTITSMVLVQWAFAAGPLAWSIATMTAVNPVISLAIGCAAFDTAVSIANAPMVAAAVALLALGAAGVSRASVESRVPVR